MIPVLYDGAISDMSIFNTGFYSQPFGLGRLVDALTCTVTEELNGGYELTMTYPTKGLYADQIVPRTLIAVFPSYTGDLQPFRVYKVSDNGKGVLTVQARHISYDYAGYIMPTFTNLDTRSYNASQALVELKNHCYSGSGFNYQASGITTTVNGFSVRKPSTLRGCLIGQEGSIVDLYGGEIEWDVMKFILTAQRGEDTGTIIRYKKNLSSFSKEISEEKHYTHIQPFYKYTNDSQEETYVYGSLLKTDTQCHWNYEKEFLLDATQHFGETIPTVTQLNNYATKYAKTNKLAEYTSTIKVGVLTIEDLEERVSLGDTVHVLYEKENITTRVRKTVWDVLAERYKSITVGDQGETITQTIKNIK